MANKKDDLDFEQRSMAGLLAKFRIDYSDLKLLPDITKKASDSTYKFFGDLIKEFKANEDDGDEGKLGLGEEFVRKLNLIYNQVALQRWN